MQFWFAFGCLAVASVCAEQRKAYKVETFVEPRYVEKKTSTFQESGQRAIYMMAGLVPIPVIYTYMDAHSYIRPGGDERPIGVSTQVGVDNKLQLDFWSEPSLVRSTDIRVSPTAYRSVMDMMKEAGLSPDIRHSDVQSLIDKEQEKMTEARKMSPYASKDIESEYLTFPEIEEFLNELAAEFPDRVEKSSIGKSVEGRDLIKIRVASNLADTSKPVIWIEAMTHAREWITGASALYTIRRLARQQDREAIDMLDQYDWYFAPVHNPDGYVYSHTTDRMWRKNRKEQNECSWWGCYTCYGTDLNRNWDVSWAGEGTSPYCDHDTYHGVKAFSEPETANLRDAIMSTPNRKAFFSIHSYSELIMIPNGYIRTKPDDYDEVKRVADAAQKALKAIHGKSYRVGTPPDILYAATGGAFDYMRTRDGPNLKWSYTYELRPADAEHGGFVLDTKWILPTAEELFASLNSFAYEIAK
ncbi:hypothetical protein ScPMuIL_002712 [Solemya velum]